MRAFRTTAAGLLAAGIVFSHLCAAQTKQPDSALFYYSNGIKQPLTLDPSRQLDISANPQIVPLPSISTKTANPKLSSPLFVDTVSNTLRGLPGGVVVEFARGISELEARQRLQNLGLTAVQNVVPTTVWLVASDPGLASLALANRLAESGAFVSAQPNWWRARSTK
jgi:hypothetical protein